MAKQRSISTKKWSKKKNFVLDSPFENAAPLENASEKIIRERRCLFEMVSKAQKHV